MYGEDVKRLIWALNNLRKSVDGTISDLVDIKMLETPSRTKFLDAVECVTKIKSRKPMKVNKFNWLPFSREFDYLEQARAVGKDKGMYNVSDEDEFCCSVFDSLQHLDHLCLAFISEIDKSIPVTSTNYQMMLLGKLYQILMSANIVLVLVQIHHEAVQDLYDIGKKLEVGHISNKELREE